MAPVTHLEWREVQDVLLKVENSSLNIPLVIWLKPQGVNGLCSPPRRSSPADRQVAWGRREGPPITKIHNPVAEEPSGAFFQVTDDALLELLSN